MLKKNNVRFLLRLLAAFAVCILTVYPAAAHAEDNEEYTEHTFKPFTSEILSFYGSSVSDTVTITYGFPSSWKTKKEDGETRIYPNKKDEQEYILISVLPVAEYEDPSQTENVEKAIQHLTKDAPAVEKYTISNTVTERYTAGDVPFAKVSYDRTHTDTGKAVKLHHIFYAVPVSDFYTLLVEIVLPEGNEQKYTESEEAVLLTAAANNEYVFAGYLSKFPNAQMPQFELGTTAAKTAAETPAPEKNEPAVTYVLNIKSKKFHKPTCSSVDDMSPKNRQDSTLTRDEIIDMGYDPCKRCNP